MNRKKKTTGPVSEARRVANRSNAQKSTGPRTPEGKAKVSLNAITHGITTKSCWLTEEERGRFVIYERHLRLAFAPANAFEEDLFDKCTECSSFKPRL